MGRIVLWVTAALGVIGAALSATVNPLWALVAIAAVAIIGYMRFIKTAVVGGLLLILGLVLYFTGIGPTLVAGGYQAPSTPQVQAPAALTKADVAQMIERSNRQTAQLIAESNKAQLDAVATMIAPKPTATPDVVAELRASTDAAVSGERVAIANPEGGVKAAPKRCTDYTETGVGGAMQFKQHVPANMIYFIDAVQVGKWSNTLLVVPGPNDVDLLVQTGAICGVPIEWKDWAAQARLAAAKVSNPDTKVVHFKNEK